MLKEQIQGEDGRIEKRAATLLMDGLWQPSRSGQTFPSLNPATGECIGLVSAGDASDVDAAVKVARAAFEDRRWLKLATTERAKIMFSIADRIDSAIEELAINEVHENGMPLSIARWSIGVGAELPRSTG